MFCPSAGTKYPFFRFLLMDNKSKRNNLGSFFQENLTDSKKLWNKINELINTKQIGMDDIFHGENSVMITKQRIVANEFNKCFINVAQNLLKDLGRRKQ